MSDDKGGEMNVTPAAEALVEYQVDRSIMSFEEISNIADKRAAIFDKTTRIALQKLNRREIVDFSGSPYISSAGCEKVSRYFGVSWKLQRPEKEEFEDEDGKYYVFTVEGEFGFGKDRREPINAFGRCSTRDKFFAKVSEWTTDPDTGEKHKKSVLRPQSDVDICNVMGKAQSNAIHTGVTMLLGLRGLTWEDIEKLVPGLRESVSKVEFDEGGDRSGRTGKRKGSTGKSTDAQRKMIFAKCKQKDIDPNELTKKVAGCALDDLPFDKVNDCLNELQKGGK